MLSFLGTFLSSCGLRPSLPERSDKLPPYQFTTSGPHKIASMVSGDAAELGARLIFVHGTPGSGEMWQNYLLKMPSGCEVVALDRIGFGNSSRLDYALTVIEQSRTLQPLLDTKKKNILIGHSLGGPVVLGAAALFTERVDAVVTLAGSADPKLEEPRWYNWFASTWLGRLVLPTSWIYSNLEIYQLSDGLRELSSQLSAIKAPVFIVQGDKDWLVEPSNANYIRDRLSNSAHVEVRMIPGASHFLPWSEEAAVRDAIKSALDHVP